MAKAIDTPLLWHLKVSHYNEKARWALDFKGVPHLRRAVTPGRHHQLAHRLTGGSTLPVLMLDGKAVGDSTRIIGALERRYPNPPLYPSEQPARRRALEIEDYFDEELGPHLRLLVLNSALADPDLLLGTFAPDLVGFRRLVARVMFPQVRSRVTATFGIDDARVALAYEKVRSAGARFRAELESSGYLVGEEFTVADLTLAALAAPAVAPEQFPYPQPQRGHPLLAPVRDALAEAGLLEWTKEIYARHRGPSAEIS
jgi:glutathione S-transferase